jgi:hypothetical protein
MEGSAPVLKVGSKARRVEVTRQDVPQTIIDDADDGNYDARTN